MSMSLCAWVWEYGRGPCEPSLAGYYAHHSEQELFRFVRRGWFLWLVVGIGSVGRILRLGFWGRRLEVQWRVSVGWKYLGV